MDMVVKNLLLGVEFTCSGGAECVYPCRLEAEFHVSDSEVNILYILHSGKSIYIAIYDM